MQSCVRRRLAYKELRASRPKTKPSNFKELFYRLENKVAELSQMLRKRMEEERPLQKKLEELTSPTLGQASTKIPTACESATVDA